MSRRILFIMDPLETVKLDHDTTFAIMLEHARRGDETFFAETRDLSWRSDVRVVARQVFPRRDEAAPFSPAVRRAVLARDFEVVWMRKDPPFDLEYYYATLLLSRMARPTLVVNDPRALREANEKLYALRFSAWTPESIVTRSKADLVEFARSVDGTIVVKPLDGMGGRGVFLVRDGDPNRNALLETVTANGARTAIGQRYLPEVERGGDKRVLLVGGRPVGAIRRLPSSGDLRANVAAGGTCARCDITDRERALCDDIGETLRRDGLHFVGIDVIGGFLTEVNVTSPTCVQEINRANGVSLEREIVDYIEMIASSDGARNVE